MDLDNLERFRQLDPQGMWQHIVGLPAQLAAAWELRHRLTFSAGEPPRQIVLAGMGGSAIGADLVAAYAVPRAPVPILVWRDYSLPAWARGPETLVVVSSHSGNTEEALSAYDAGREAQVRLLAAHDRRGTGPPGEAGWRRPLAICPSGPTSSRSGVLVCALAGRCCIV